MAANLKNICECFQGLIGLRDICAPSEDCELYINSHPGIDSQILASLTTMERQTVQQIFHDLEKNAAIHLHTKLTIALQENFKRKYDSGLIITGEFECNNPIEIEQESALTGFVLDLDDSPYLEAEITEIRVNVLQEVAGVNVWIFNLDSGKLETLYQIDLVEGVNYISIDPVLCLGNKGARYFIALDLQQVQLVAPCVNCCSSCGHSYEVGRHDYSYGQAPFRSGGSIQNQIRSPYMYDPRLHNYPQYRCDCEDKTDTCYKYSTDLEPINQDSIINPNDLERIGHCPFVLCYRKKCSWTQLMCKNKNELAVAYWYQLGVAFWNSPSWGKMVGTFQMLDKEEIQARQNQLRGLRDQAIKAFVKNLQADNVCFECEPTYSVYSTIP